MELLVLAVVVAVFVWYLNTWQKNANQAEQIVLSAMSRVPGFLQEKLAMGPWVEVEDTPFIQVVWIKCTSCEKDRTWACKSNDEVYLADLHYAKTKTRIVFGQECLFNGSAIDLLKYPISDHGTLTPEAVLKLTNETEASKHAARAASAYNEFIESTRYSVPEEKLNELRPRAEKGDAEAQYELGTTYYEVCCEGEGAEGRDFQEAVRWFRKAAEQDHRDAQYELGMSYKRGEGVNKDLALAAYWFDQAALPAENQKIILHDAAIRQLKELRELGIQPQRPVQEQPSHSFD